MSEQLPDYEETSPPVLDYRAPQACASGDRWTGWNTAWLILACIGLLLLVGYMLLPDLSHPPEHGNRVRCSSHLRQIGQAIVLYRNDHRVWPQSLAQVMAGTDLNAECFVCPSSSAKPAGGATVQEMAQALANPKHCSYVYFPPPASAGDLSPDAILVVERVENHEGEGMNVLFGDGHAEWCGRPQVQRILRELQAGHNPPREPTRPSTLPSAAPATGGTDERGPRRTRCVWPTRA